MSALHTAVRTVADGGFGRHGGPAGAPRALRRALGPLAAQVDTGPLEVVIVAPPDEHGSLVALRPHGAVGSIVLPGTKEARSPGLNSANDVATNDIVVRVHGDRPCRRTTSPRVVRLLGLDDAVGVVGGVQRPIAVEASVSAAAAGVRTHGCWASRVPPPWTHGSRGHGLPRGVPSSRDRVSWWLRHAWPPTRISTCAPGTGTPDLWCGSMATWSWSMSLGGACRRCSASIVCSAPRTCTSGAARAGGPTVGSRSPSGSRRSAGYWPWARPDALGSRAHSPSAASSPSWRSTSWQILRSRTRGSAASCSASVAIAAGWLTGIGWETCRLGAAEEAVTFAARWVPASGSRRQHGQLRESTQAIERAPAQSEELGT